MDTELLRITCIKASGLFGLYNHIVDLKVIDRITIIHGPNGVGKTALLRLVDALVKGKYFEIAKIPLESFVLQLSDGSTVGVRKQADRIGQLSLDDDENNRTSSDRMLEVFIVPPDGKEQKKTISPDKIGTPNILRQLSNDLPWIIRLDRDQWIDRRDERIYSPDELIAAFAHKLPPKTRKKIFAEPEWLTEIRSRISVHLIETQRLLRISNVPPRMYSHGLEETVVSTVRNYAKELHEKIADALADYGKTSQSLDQSFPQRLLSGNRKPLSVEDLKGRMKDLEEKRNILKKIGLLDEDTAYPFDTGILDRADQTEKAAMTLYVDDTARKLGVLDGLANRVTLLLENINKKFKNKSISIDKKKGIVAADSNGHELDLDSLSSGEQHELVLIYDLLFRVLPNTLVLIDEPELSLHLNWQKTFLSDLARIVNTASFDVLLATHSPFIAGERDDLMINLVSEKG
jgi:predicted ATP-binding protein involved in virulence